MFEFLHRVSRSEDKHCVDLPADWKIDKQILTMFQMDLVIIPFESAVRMRFAEYVLWWTKSNGINFLCHYRRSIWFGSMCAS